MKENWKEWGLAFLMAWVVPWVATSLLLPTEEPKAPVETTAAAEPVEISVIHGDAMVTMALEEYLVGVLLGELPDDFSLEAKKAQAVVARTYALAAVERGIKHPGAVCTDSSCCQSWAEPESYWSKEGVASAKAAVEATRGQVISYEGKLIEATYFSGSGGRTEAAVAVWGSDIPYLQSVESPGEEKAAWHSDRKDFTVAEFEQALGISLTGVPGTWFGVITYTSGGGVKTADICGTSFPGTELRTKLNLRSTAFTLSASEQGVTVYTRGHGHRVGLSQYGTDAMALAGSDYQTILRHYYPGTTVEMYPSSS